MRRIHLFLLLILCLMGLTGCTKEANRIYTVCKTDGKDTYCYDDKGEFYFYTDDTLVKTSGVGLQAYPALHVIPSEGDFNFTKELPGKYRGTLTSVNHYAYKLLQDVDSELKIVYQDWNNIEVIITCAKYSTRILYNIQGDIRIYAVDNSNNPMTPAYINSK